MIKGVPEREKNGAKCHREGKRKRESGRKEGRERKRGAMKAEMEKIGRKKRKCLV